MSRLNAVMAGLLCCGALAGCTTDYSIMAAAVDTVGIGIAGGPQAQGASLTVGYTGAKFAVVPVENRLGQSFGPEAYSVFAMLGLDAKGGTSGTVLGASVEQVLATGRAAEIWAAGRAQRTATLADIARAKAAGLTPADITAFKGVLR